MSKVAQLAVHGPVRPLTVQVRTRLTNRDHGDGGLLAPLEESLWLSLPWQAALQEEAQDQDSLFEAYTRSIVGLEKNREECVAFLGQVCQTSLEFHAEGTVHPAARANLLRSEMERLSRFITLSPSVPDTVFNAQLTNEPLEKVIKVLTVELRRRTANLVQHFLELCVDLVEKEVVGLIEWANPGACQFFHFKRVLIQRRTSRVVQEGQAREEAIPGGTRIVTSRTEYSAGEHEIRQARHEHHLHHAAAVSLDEIKFPIPQEFQELLRTVPGWLRPALRLVTGVQFRGKIQEIEVGRKNWEQVRSLPPKEEYRIRVDPALVLGPLVFAGWDDEQQEIENQRLDLDAKTQLAGEIRTLRSSIVDQGLVLFMLWQAVALVLVGAGVARGSGLFWPGVVMAVAGLGLVVGVVHYDFLSRERRAGLWTYIVAVLAAASGVASCQFLGAAIIQNSLAFGLAGVIGLFVAWNLLEEFKKNRSL